MHMRLLNRRRAHALIVGITLAPALSVAQAVWPRKPVRIVVAFAPGGFAGLLARTLAPELQAAFGQPFVVDHVAGAGGIVGSAQVARLRGDSHTLLMATVGTHAINASLQPNLPYDPLKDFVPVTLVAEAPHLLVMNAAKARQYGIRSLPDFIRYAKAHPGALNMGSSGNGTSSHLAGELFKRMTATHMVHFPYRGTAPALLDLLAGNMDLMFDTVPSSLPHIRSRMLTAFAVATTSRCPAVPEVPTMEEVGGVALKGYRASAWWGLVAPAGIPTDVVARLQQEVAKALRSPALSQWLLSEGAIPGGMTSADFARYIAAEIKMWAGVVKLSGAKVD